MTGGELSDSRQGQGQIQRPAPVPASVPDNGRKKGEERKRLVPFWGADPGLPTLTLPRSTATDPVAAHRNWIPSANSIRDSDQQQWQE